MPIWPQLAILSTLITPSPVLMEPVPLPSQQWNDSAVVAVENPITMVNTSVKTPLVQTSGKKSQYKVAKSNQRPSNPANLGSSCVNYAHAVVGIKQPIGWARNQPINSKQPAVKSIVVTTESSVGTRSGHLAVVTEVKPDGIVVSEANYVRGKITHGRFIAFNSGKIRGYYLPPSPETD